MDYRWLGRTGLQVSRVALGAVEIGTEYGLAEPGLSPRPSVADAIDLIRRSIDLGINLIDTAPGYGDSEELIGKALDQDGYRNRCIIATKCPGFRDRGLLTSAQVNKLVAESIANSLKRLRVERLEIVQIHYATVDSVRDNWLLEPLHASRRAGDIGWLGISTYHEPETLLAVESGAYDVIQIPYNLLNQQMATNVLPLAQARGVGVLIRSALLKGALTDKVANLPGHLRPLQERVAALHSLATAYSGLPELAFRFCLDHPSATSVLIGTRRLANLEAAVAWAQAGSLPAHVVEQAYSVAMEDPSSLDLSQW